MSTSRILSALVVVVMLASLGAPALAEDEAEPGLDLLSTAQEQYQKGQWAAAKQSYEEAYEAASDDSRVKAHAALEWSSLLWEQGEYAQASARIEEALELARDLEMNEALGRLLLTRGHIQASRGKLKSGENTLKLCIGLAKEQGDEVFSALCELNHRMVRQLRGRPVGPESDFREAIAKLEAAGTPLSAGTSLAKTAELYRKGGDHEAALEMLGKAQEQFERAESVPAKMRNRLRIARLHQEQGRFGQARKYLGGLEEAFGAMENRPALVDALVLGARDAQQRGELSTAKDKFERALSVARQTKSPSMVARGHLALCEFGVDSGQLDDVAEHCGAAQKRFDKLGIPELAARSSAQLAGLYHNAGQLNQASSQYSRAVHYLEQTRLGDRSEMARFRANLCQVEMTLESNGAHHLCLKALKDLEAHEAADPGMLASTHYAVGVTAGRAWRTKKGLDHLQQAADLASSQEPPNLNLASDALLRRGVLLAEEEDESDEAKDSFRRGLDLTSEASDGPMLATRIQLRTQLTQLELAEQNWETAQRLLEELIDETKGDRPTRAWAYSALARTRLKLGDRDGAKEALEAGLPLAKKAGDAALVETFEENLERFE
jgi:tetratricopeptide (TPR) repeat protein